MSERGAPRSTRLALRILSWLVPGDRRSDWLAEWEGEVEALARARARGDRAEYPGWMEFVSGALPHAAATRMEGWTVDSVIQDLKFAVRVLWRAPVFTLVAALTLALGIGANASIFSLVNGLLLRPPPGIAEPDRLVQIARSYDDAPRWDSWSWPALRTIASEARTLSGVAGYQDRPLVLGRGAQTEQLLGQVVTGEYFDVLGATPHVGRLLQPSDDLEPGAHAVVVLSHALWTERFGADPDVVGSTVAIGAQPYEVVGVAPPAFAGVEAVTSPPQLWIPTMQLPESSGLLRFEEWGSSWIQVVGRMRDGVGFQEVEASMDVVTARMREAEPRNEDIRVLVAEGVGMSPDEAAQARMVTDILMMIVGLLLLLACTNVANVFLARATGRRTEVGVRMALGAGRARLARQLLTECVVIALFATALAVPVVMASGRFLPALLPYTLAVPVGPDGSVFAFLLVVGLAAGVLFGLAPAWASTRRGVLEALKEGAATASHSRTRLRDALVVAQLALSLGLVSGAALLGRSVVNARTADPGYEPEGLVGGFVNLASTGRYGDERAVLETYSVLLREVEEMPGVTSVTLANQVPIAGGHSRSTVRPVERPDVGYEAEYNTVGPDYFETLGIPLLRGRTLGGLADEPERVVVVNAALAGMFWPGEDPIGKEITGRGTTWRVVGLVGDVQMRTLREQGRPGVYYPMAQQVSPYVVVAVRSEAGAEATLAALGEAVAAVDPELPVAQTYDLHAALSISMGETRTIGRLVGAFAGIALLLAAVGLYGVVSYAASQRARELGIRIALGARPEALTRLLVTKGLIVSVAGLLIGLGVSYVIGRALAGLLFGVGATDALTLGMASAALLGTAALATWIPAYRASRVDAVVSLRG